MTSTTTTRSTSAPSMNAPSVSARHRNVNRAEVCDRNFAEFVHEWNGTPRRAPRADEPVLP